MTTLGKRIDQAMQAKQMSRKQLAEVLGISTMAVGNLINDETKKPRNLIEIATALEVDPVWLLTGQGDSQNIERNAIDKSNNDSDVVLDVLDKEASAGGGVLGGDTLEIVRQLRYSNEQYNLLFRGMNPKKIRVISAKGDSMHPTIPHGALMFVDVSVDYFDADGIYIFNYDDYNYVKRLQKAGKVLRVISDNKELYPEHWEISGEELAQVYILGKVKAVQDQTIEFIG